MNRAHTLQEVVDAGWAPSVMFLTLRLRRGEISGHKIGRHWRMSDADVQDYLESTRNRASVEEPRRIGLTAASMRRRAS